MRRCAEGIMARGKRRQREEPVEEPVEPDLEPDLDDECRKSPLICMATYEDC
jgi:hypothetical protein